MNKHKITDAVKGLSMMILLFLVIGMMFGCSTQEKDSLTDETSSMIKENQTTALVSDAGDESESEIEEETYVRAVTEDGMCYFEG